VDHKTLAGGRGGANVDAVFLGVCQLLRAMRSCDSCFPGSTDADDCSGRKNGSNAAPTVFVVAGKLPCVRPQYTLAFRSGSILLLSAKEFEQDSQNADNMGANQPLYKFYLHYRAVYRILFSIGQTVRYFCVHAARKNGQKFCLPKQSFCLRGGSTRNIREFYQQIENFFDYIINDTKAFMRDGSFDWDNMKAMFDCIEIYLKRTDKAQGEATVILASVQEAWHKFANHSCGTGKKFDSKYKFPLSCSHCNETRYCSQECAWKCNDTSCRENPSKEELIAGFRNLMHVFSHEWWEPFDPYSKSKDTLSDDPNSEFYNPVQEIQQICESGRVFYIPDFKSEFLSFAFCRISIETHLSPDVRLLGETALMAAACNCNEKFDVDSLLRHCSISQVLSKSEHAQASGLDALFMSIFYLRISVSEKIIRFILKSCTGNKLHVHPFCKHPVLGCTTFMLACRYGNVQLLDGLFEVLELWIRSQTTDSTLNT
jgi:hypothetical protein